MFSVAMSELLIAHNSARLYQRMELMRWYKGYDVGLTIVNSTVEFPCNDSLSCFTCASLFCHYATANLNTSLQLLSSRHCFDVIRGGHQAIFKTL